MNALPLQRLQALARPLLGRLPTLTAAVLAVGLAHSLAQATWKVLPAPEESPPPAAVPVGSAPGPKAVVEDWGERLVRTHLFGQAPAAPAPVPAAAPIEAPETSLRLTLRGVYLEAGRTEAFAIIADERGSDETYRPGDALPGGATLEEIYPDRVILQRQGRLETLRLPREENPGAATAPRRRTAAASSGAVSVPPQAGEVLSRYRQQLLTDPQSVMDVVRAEPYRRGGRILGYRVFPGRDRTLLSQVGLQSGDVITEVNGLGLDNPLNGLEIMRGLQTASQVSVKVLRNGVEQELTVSLP